MTEHKAAIVTGASSGIGYAIAAMLGRDGYGLTVAARRPEKLEAAAKRLRADGLAVEAVAGNLGEEAVICSVIERHTYRYGRLDVLVNNAGVGIGEPMDGLTAKAIDLQFASNLRSVMLCTREATALLRVAGAEHGNAVIVNVASLSGKRAEPWLSVYSSTKYGVVGFTEATNKELGGDGIKAVAICPGFVDTPMTDFLKEKGIPANRMITVDDVASAVRFVLGTSTGCVVPEILFCDRTNFVESGGSLAG